jgi:peptide/nickel transport system substrate-binding protein
MDLSRRDFMKTAVTGSLAIGSAGLLSSCGINPNATATEWTLRLKPGITFHNGKALTADDVIYTFRTVMNPKSPGAAAAGLASIDAAGLAKLDPLTVRIPCKTPFATLHQALAIPTYSDIIPEGFNPAAPVGTGPFRLKSFTPGVQSTFVRYEHYWQTGLPYPDQVVVLNEGVICEDGPVAEVLHSPKDRYTTQLLADVPKLETPVGEA